MKSAPSQLQDKFIVRLTDGLRDRIQAAAAVSGRSMNTEIVRVLEAAFPPPNPEDSPAVLHHLHMIHSAKNEAERAALIAAANREFEADPSLSGIQIKVLFDPKQEFFLAYPTKRK